MPISRRLPPIITACALGLMPRLALGDEPVKTHTETAGTARHEYVIRVGGTMDGPSTRSPIGYAAWEQAFEPNVSVRMENVGATDVVNPWIVVNGRRNWRTVEDIVAEAVAGRTTDRERAIGIWQFEIGNRFHWTTGDVEDMDPVKVFNIYGYTLCGNDAHVISDLWRSAGFETRRGYPQGHCTAEVFYNGRFHHLDGDENIICLLRDNATIASEADIVRDHDLMKRTHTYGILRNDDRMTDEFSASLCVYEGHREGEHRSHIGHKMHLTLRPGEALEWRWDNRSRFHTRWTGYNVSAEVLARICNGRVIYTPNLPPLKQQNGTVWELRSPYVIVGGKIRATFVRPTEPSRCALAVSYDGKDWKTVSTPAVGASEETVDLDPELPCSGVARYTYYVRLDASADAGVEAITFESTVQMAPLSLPALELGENRIAYVSDTNDTQQVRMTHSWHESSASRPPPAPATPVFPADSAEVDGTRITFSWAAPVDPDGDAIADYHFQLSDRPDMLWHLSPNFNKLLSRTADKGTPRYALPYEGLLNPGQTYYWRVRAQDSKGVWSNWSPTWSFTPQGPGVPVSVRISQYDQERRAAILSWSANADGRPAAQYRIYGSNEKGFTLSDEPYKVLDRSIQSQSGLHGKFGREVRETPANFVCGTTQQTLTIVGPDLTFPNANKAYYRVVAVDTKDVRSGPSDYAEIQRPFIYTLPPSATATVGKQWTYEVKATSSLGDLRCRTFVRGKYVYNAGFWDQDTMRHYLHGAPSWLKIDAATGLVSGTPQAQDVGKYTFMLYADIPKVACQSQQIRLEVKPQ